MPRVCLGRVFAHCLLQRRECYTFELLVPKIPRNDVLSLVEKQLSRPDLNPLGVGMSGRPVLANIRKWRMKREKLIEMLEALLIERGVEVPADTEA